MVGAIGGHRGHTSGGGHRGIGGHTCGGGHRGAYMWWGV